MRNLFLKKKHGAAETFINTVNLFALPPSSPARPKPQMEPPASADTCGGGAVMDAGGVEDQHKAGSESGGASRRTLAGPDVPSARVKVTLLSEGRNNVEENGFPAFSLDVLLQL